ncbi:hypothetical protein FCJ59_04220 [Cupriavidus basilensis]|nr:hypothetical protein [Cupriavidus basilensis]NUA26017.1 hypothetical protein [Cupriavidus basilensis]
MTRLWIVLLPALLLGLFWDSAGIHLAWGPLYQGTEGNAAQQIDISHNLGVAGLVCNAAFLQTLACQTYGSNGPLWSLANEFWYYLWFPALYGAWHLRRTPQVLLCVLAALVTMGLFHGLVEGFLFWLLGVLAQALDSQPAWLAGWLAGNPGSQPETAVSSPVGASNARRIRKTRSIHDGSTPR